MNEIIAEKFVAIYKKIRLNNMDYKYVCTSIELVTNYDECIKLGSENIELEPLFDTLDYADIDINIDNIDSEIFTKPNLHQEQISLKVDTIDDYIESAPNYLLLDIPAFPRAVVDLIMSGVENISPDIINPRESIREEILFAISKVYGSIEIKEEKGNIYATIDNQTEDADYCFENGFTAFTGSLSKDIQWFVNYFEEKYAKMCNSKKDKTRSVYTGRNVYGRNGLIFLEEEKPTYNLTEDFSDKKIDAENLKQIIDKTSHKFVGQEDVVFELATSLYVNNMLSSKTPEQVVRTKDVILLDGSTGTGKTAIINALSKEFDIPSVCIYAPNITPTGYKGGDLTECLDKLFENAGKDIKKAERGIVYIDEFDKLSVFGNKDAATYRAMVQKELLGFGFGNVYDIKDNFKTIPFDTSKLTIIYMGSFAEVKENIKLKEKSKRKIGFSDSDNYSLENPVIDGENLIENGYLRELVGRIKLFISTKSYNKEDLINILNNSSISPLNELVEICKEDFEKTLIYDDAFIDAIADYGVRLNTGARSLQTICNSIRNIIKKDLIFGTSKEIYLTTDMIYKLEQKKGRTK